MAQRQQITQKQKQLTEQLNAPSIPPSTVSAAPKMVVTSTPSVVKTLSIKTPGLPANVNMIESKPVVVTQNDPPPLAPLSTQSNKPAIITINPNNQDGKVLVSPKLSANKMLVDLLDKKAPEPQFVTIKRKADSESDVPAKKIDLEQSGDPPVTPSSKAADLYAKLAGSILEDEDLDEEEEDEIEKSVPAKIIEKKIIEVKPSAGGSQIISTAQVQRQIIMGPNNQVILSPNSGHQTTTATIKTDSGIQSVPIIIQQQPAPALIQQPAPTQYILATNQQGQTYVVAQQPIANPQMPQTVLLAQTPGQQGQKTIIILQQPQGQHGQQTIQMAQPAQQQKIIMTPSGQQVIYSSPVQRQVIQPPLSQASIIQNSTASQSTNQRKIVITNTVDNSGKIIQQTTQQTSTKIVQATSQQTLQAIAQGQNIIMQKGQKYQIGSTQITQIVNPAQAQPQTTTVVQKIASPKPEVTSATITQQTQVVMAKETSVTITSKQDVMPQISAQEETEKDHEKENDKEEIKNEEIIEAPKESPNAPKSSPTTSQTSSGASSPAPQNKQTISIQIPVPQSQIAGPNAQQYTIKIIPSMDPSVKVKDEDVELSWPYICEVIEYKFIPLKFLQQYNFLVAWMSEEKV